MLITRKLSQRAWAGKVVRALPVRFHEVCASSLGARVSYSQMGEDIWLFDNWFNQPVDDAVLVEIGAYSGVIYSNSLMLERLTKGRTLLVEPVNDSFLACRRQRPNAMVYGCASGERFGVMEILGDSAVAGLVDEISESYIAQWGLGSECLQESVVLPLWALMRIERLDYVDVLSLDIQGSELSTLRGIDWSIPIGCFVIELENQDPRKDEECREILSDQGFVFQKRLGVSEMWTNPTYFRKGHLFNENRRPFRDEFLTPYLEPHLRDEVLESLGRV